MDVTRSSTDKDCPSSGSHVPVILGRPIVLLGDELDCLRGIRCDPSITIAPSIPALVSQPRAAILPMNLSDISKQSELRDKLHAQMQFCVDICTQIPSVQRLILVIEGPTRLPETMLYSMCTTVGDRIHSWIEQSCGLYTIVTLLLVTGADDPALLARRIHTRARQPLGIDTASTLNWKEIAKAPIGYTAANMYL